MSRAHGLLSSMAEPKSHDCKALKANRLTVNSQDLWLAKDNRFLNPKISYERILMAPPCRLIFYFYFHLEADMVPSILH